MKIQTEVVISLIITPSKLNFKLKLQQPSIIYYYLFKHLGRNLKDFQYYYKIYREHFIGIYWHAKSEQQSQQSAGEMPIKNQTPFKTQMQL